MSEIDTFEFNGGDDAWGWTHVAFMVVAPLAGLVTGIWTFFVRSMLMLGVGVVLWQIGRSQGLDFGGGCRIAAIGMFPTALLFGLVDLTGLIDSYWTFVWFVFVLLSVPFWILGMVGVSRDSGGLHSGGGPGGDVEHDPWASPSA